MDGSSSKHREIAVERFDALPALAARYAELTQTPDLRVHAGAQPFFTAFRIYWEGEARDVSRTLGLPPDPSDFLALPTGLEELRAAMTLASRLPADARIDELASAFRLAPETLRLPLRRLSGGERASLALAKVAALEPAYDALIIANPTVWLDLDRRHLAQVAISAFAHRGKAVTLLAVHGDWPQVDGSFEAYVPAPEGGRALTWELEADGVRVQLPASAFPTPAPGRLIEYAQPSRLRLASPTLITGANGVGKSTLAAVLCGMRAPEGLPPAIRTKGHVGLARLLMQDSILQMFSLTPAGHCAFAFRYAKDLRKQALADLHAFDLAFGGYVYLGEETIGGIGRQTGERTSMVHCKFALALERMASRPSLVILDEPSWGLSGRLARALFIDIRDACHATGVPLAVISHDRTWLEGLYASQLTLSVRADKVVLERADG